MEATTKRSSQNTWKLISGAVLAYEGASAISKFLCKRNVTTKEIPFITEKVRPLNPELRIAASIGAGVLVSQALKPLPRSVRNAVAVFTALDLLDHFRPNRRGFFPFASTLSEISS